MTDLKSQISEFQKQLALLTVQLKRAIEARDHDMSFRLIMRQKHLLEELDAILKKS